MTLCAIITEPVVCVRHNGHQAGIMSIFKESTVPATTMESELIINMRHYLLRKPGRIVGTHGKGRGLVHEKGRSMESVIFKVRDVQSFTSGYNEMRLSEGWAKFIK